MSTSLLIIGDVHGDTLRYDVLLKAHQPKTSIQVGDFGFAKAHKWHLENVDSNSHKVLFGNHDDYTFLHQAHSLGNWSYDDKTGIFTVRGAYSIDRAHRTESRDWWREEEMNYTEMTAAVAAYFKIQPRIVISHDCPYTVSRLLFNYGDKSTTGNGLQAMFEDHQPELWIFGHHHKPANDLIDGTRFICLGELQTMWI